MWALRRRIILSWRSVRPRARYGEAFKGEKMSGMLKKALFVMLPLSLAVGDAKAQSSYDLRSPNNRIELRIRTANGIRYDVLLGGRAILQDCTLSIDVDHKKLGTEPKVLKHKEGSQDRVLEPVVRQKFAKIRENYKELHLDLDGGYGVTFRAYNEGAAYRLETSLPQADVKIYGEEMNLNFPSNYVVYYPEEESFFSHNERKYLPRRLSAIDPAFIATLPAVVDVENGAKVDGVDFKAGVNTQTYKYYIDFAAKYGIPYILLDAGWYRNGDVLDVVPEVNMEELTAYAKEKNVRVILWVLWNKLGDQLEKALDQYAKWGIAGIKVDFMQRSDQKLINYYHKVSQETAKRKMLVDFHGDQKPATMTRTWPNLIGTEGVRGMEWDKWSAETDPDHDVTLPFTRMVLGPMDYTPGAMLNAQKNDFRAIGHRPMSQGTRCHQLAMYVVFEAPLQMLSDSPSNYLREPEIMEFLGPVPSEWDDTKVLDGKIAQYVAVARRNGKDWYVGAMTNWSPRELEIDFSFLPEGNFTLQAYQDGVNADRMGSDYKMVKSQVNRGTKLKIKLAPGGGWAGRIVP